jgi:hypothetical protein
MAFHDGLIIGVPKSDEEKKNLFMGYYAHNQIPELYTDMSYRHRILKGLPEGASAARESVGNMVKEISDFAKAHNISLVKQPELPSEESGELTPNTVEA